ncbi:carbohydrate sulfotransferase 4-like [Penaeus japonicus]|uniref:carbohydrate sulfotransferase 4-like n=1 Tax=Penaeus japonicus TaxID=27405 RepID=UPI001C711854|nr:carbohydrate sulfotransferase 4-like [Penaeus japonicus]
MSQAPVCVLVVAPSHRTGSSYLGELLASPRSSVYFFEPLWYFPTYEKIYHVNSDRLREVIKLLFTCQLTSIKYIFPDLQSRKFILRRPRGLSTLQDLDVIERICKASEVRVMKVVRAQLYQVLPLLYTTNWSALTRMEEEIPSHSPSFKLIYLIRDPRAILTSILEREMDFSPQRKDPELLCETILQDLQALKALPRQHHHSVTVVRYEDMVTDAVGSAQRLFRFSNLPLTSEVYQFLLDHNKDRSAFSLPTLRYASPTQTLFRRAWPSLIRQHSPRNATKANKYSFSHLILYKNQVYNVKKYMKKRRKRMESGYTYYSTYKRPNKPIDRWKNELNQETRARLEEACGPALQEFEYN